MSESDAELKQQLIERTRELELVTEELASFGYSVSHDLRAPLRSIDGFSRALLEDYADQLDAQGQDDLQRVRAAAQRMNCLIDDLLQLSRVTRAELRREPTDLSVMAHETVAQLAQAQPERRSETHIESKLTAHVDASLMRLALEHLIGNAWKFTAFQPNARIEFGARRSRRDEEEDSDNGAARSDNSIREHHGDSGKVRDDAVTTYFVRDNGVGFDMAYAGKLFGAFQRLHSTMEFAGTGIGLAITQRIIRRHGGRIWAEGEHGRGATFRFTLK